MASAYYGLPLRRGFNGYCPSRDVVLPSRPKPTSNMHSNHLPDEVHFTIFREVKNQGSPLDNRS
ncbi:hypothetical protein BC628DRAFT_1379259 [Trametes gibbosa]|nr:hypothetical protein BC628DRAFT_1379259 [Trametes gibbosa]